MSYNDTVTFEDGYRQVEEELASGSLHPKTEPKELPLDEIRMRHSVFQPRDFESTAQSEDHVRTLTEAIRNEPNNRLDPVTVWWSGKHWTVLNGHHRILAYDRLKRKPWKQHQPNGRKSSRWMVPVRCFKGTLQQALIEATRENSKDHLSMTKDEKFNQAWKFTALYPEMSKATVAGACKVSSRTVANMRSQLKIIQESEPEDWQSEALGMTWKEAQQFGKTKPDHGDDWMEKQALEWSQRLGKAFGTKLATQPEIAARALELYSERLAEQLAEHWRGPEDEDLEPDF
ncbi:hypothetical protein [Pistricoccus aurantiacus]|uniref:hypothetical protein n=1 Tax=Pistricoccus aurantiacus TaxID=1883414 RepID=UPI00362B0E0B